jgi:hypothetical protein
VFLGNEKGSWVGDPNYAKLAKEAEEAVKDLKEPALSIAYGKILDELIAREKQKLSSSVIHKTPTGKVPPEISTDDPVQVFLTRPVDASPYADLFRAPGKLVMKCLAVLKLARDEFGIDGLGPTALEGILKRKFRASGVHIANISRDLGNALKYVSRINRDGKPVYILTAQGEESLKLAISNLASPSH